MAQTIEKLVAANLRRMTKPGMHSDGGGLYLQITKAGAKTWIFRYSRNDRTRDMGLGSLQAVSLSDARSKASDCRGLLASGIDPIDWRDAERQAELQAAALEAALAIPFKECAEQYIAGHKKGWCNPKHRQQWENTLKTYAHPVIGDLAAHERKERSADLARCEGRGGCAAWVPVYVSGLGVRAHRLFQGSHRNIPGPQNRR